MAVHVFDNAFIDIRDKCCYIYRQSQPTITRQINEALQMCPKTDIKWQIKWYIMKIFEHGLTLNDTLSSVL